MDADRLAIERMSKEITQHFADIAHLRGQVAYLEAENAELKDTLREIQKMRGASDGWLDIEITKVLQSQARPTMRPPDECPTCKGFCHVSDCNSTAVMVCPTCKGTGIRR